MMMKGAELHACVGVWCVVCDAVEWVCVSPVSARVRLFIDAVAFSSSFVLSFFPLACLLPVRHGLSSTAPVGDRVCAGVRG